MRRLGPLLLSLTLVAAACGGSDDGAESTVAPDVSSQPEVTDDGSPVSEVDVPSTEPEPAATEAEPAPSEPPAIAPVESEPALSELPDLGPGEYEVGVQTITITDENRDRPLTVDVWFPLADGTTGDPNRYTFITGDYYQSPDAIAADATSISPDGPFPLVVYSHGSGGLRYIASNYTETLASHGYLVVAPDHTGNTAVERVSDSSDDREVIALNRPQDVRAVIDAMADPDDPETAGFTASVDPERIAVTGHSFGGFTTYAVASGYENDIGSVEPDPRVDAIIPIAPAVGGDDPSDQLLSDGRLESITTPALVIVGTNDQTTPNDPNVTRAWELTESSPSYRLELVDAQHNTFTDICDYLEFFPSLPEVNPLVIETIESQAVEGCSPGDMPIRRAQELTNTFAVSFLDSIFADGEMISAESTDIPEDVNYLVK